MKKVLIIICLLIVASILLLVKFSTNNECESISGGSFGLNFETNGGNFIELTSVCVACPPNSYKDLPVPTKEGFTFDGWYYDKNLTKKVEGTTTLDVEPNPILKDTCITGYNTVTIYAKWK